MIVDHCKIYIWYDLTSHGNMIHYWAIYVQDDRTRTLNIWGYFGFASHTIIPRDSKKADSYWWTDQKFTFINIIVLLKKKIQFLYYQYKP